MDRDQTLAGGWLNGLVSGGLTHGYVLQPDLEAYQQYLHAMVGLAAAEPDLPPGKLAELVYEHSLCTLKIAMLDPKNGRRLSMGAQTVRELVRTVWEEEVTRDALLLVMTGDRQVFQHSLNVCLLGISFARTLGWSAAEGEALGLGLFFHDLGLTRSLPDLLSRPEATYRDSSDPAIRDHPYHSYRYLSHLPGISSLSLEIVLNHHENLDGTGYPRGLAGSRLATHVRLARIVDAYESCTSGCLTVRAIGPFTALKQMTETTSGLYDRRLLGAFVRFLGQA